MKRFFAFFVTVVCAITGLAPAGAENFDLPALNMDVSYFNKTDDGQADVRITVYYFMGSGPYQQDGMENLNVTLECLNGLEVDTPKFSVEWAGSFQQFFAHLTYKDPGAGYAPEENKEQRPILRIHATTLNCGEVDYTCYFDARSHARAYVIVQTERENGKPAAYSEVLRRSGYLVGRHFEECAYQYHIVDVKAIFNPEDFWKNGIDYALNSGSDDNDITYIYLATHGGYNYGENHGNGTLDFFEKSEKEGEARKTVKIEDIAKAVQEIKGRVVVILDSCFSGRIVEEAEKMNLDTSRFFFASATTSYYEAGTAIGPGYRNFDIGIGETFTEAIANYNVMANLLDQVYQDATNEKPTKCSDLVRKYIWYYDFIHTAINLIFYLVRTEGNYFGIGKLTELYERIQGKVNENFVTLVLNQLFVSPYNITQPCSTGFSDLPLFVKDETYDDGYHKLLVFDEEKTLFAPRYVVATVFDEDTKEAIPDAKVTIIDTNGYQREETADSKGRWAKVLTDKTIRLVFRSEDYEDVEKLLRKEDAPSGSAEMDIPVGMRKSIAKFYLYLRDWVVPRIGLVSDTPFISPDFGLADALRSSSSGLISAAVCDLNGDGKNEMITVSGGDSSQPYTVYGYQLNLYGQNRDTGAVELWDTVDDVACAIGDACDGYLTVHMQQSEDAIYLICYASVGSFTATVFDHSSRRFYRVEGRQIEDITDYESQLRGNSGLSLHRSNNQQTVLCRADLEWNGGVTRDYTQLAAYLQDVKSAKCYRPVIVDMSAYTDARNIDAGQVAQLISAIESQVCQVVHLYTFQEENGQTSYSYDTDLGCGLMLWASDDDGSITKVRIYDDDLYDLDQCLDDMDGYLNSDMTEELKTLLRCVLRTLGINGELPETLIGNKMSVEHEVSYYNERETAVGSAALLIQKAIYTAGAEDNGSFVDLIPGGAAAIAEPTLQPATPEPAAELPSVFEAPETTPESVPMIPLQEQTAQEAPLMSFTQVSLAKDQLFPVYAAPSSKSYRGAKGKASVSTNGPVWAAGYDGNWLLVEYETNKGSVRVGYIDARKIKGNRPDLDALQFAKKSVSLAAAAALTDDPIRGGNVMKKLKAGTNVTLLMQWEDWAYVETSVDGKNARGFVPLSVVNY